MQAAVIEWASPLQAAAAGVASPGPHKQVHTKWVQNPSHSANNNNLIILPRIDTRTKRGGARGTNTMAMVNRNGKRIKPRLLLWSKGTREAESESNINSRLHRNLHSSRVGWGDPIFLKLLVLFFSLLPVLKSLRVTSHHIRSFRLLCSCTVRFVPSLVAVHAGTARALIHTPNCTTVPVCLTTKRKLYILSGRSIGI